MDVEEAGRPSRDVPDDRARAPHEAPPDRERRVARGPLDDAAVAAGGSDAARFYADFLARVTTHLGASLDLDVMLRGLADAAVPVVADWCVVEVVEADGVLHRVATAHGAAEDPALGAPTPAPSALADGTDPATAAVRTRRTQLVAANDAGCVGTPCDPRPRSWLAVPLVARGLGLGVVRQLAELLGGDVTVSSERGVGSRFDVWLPSRPDHGRDAPARHGA